MKSFATTLFLILLAVTPIAGLSPQQTSYEPTFNGEAAYDYLVDQTDFGTRPPGSENLSLCKSYIVDTLERLGWNVTLQNFTYLGVQCSNIIGKWSDEMEPSLILGAHYDTRPLADNDPSIANRTHPVLGANDAASGVAVLLELAEVLPTSAREEIEFVFFDAEDSGGINGWDWIVGSNYYVSQLSQARIETITAMILLDMVGDENLVLRRETSSTRTLQDTVWSVAAELGHDDVFVDVLGRAITDDHRPFLNAGIASLDIIQHDPFPSSWHTVGDIPEKCSPDSLETVGQVVEVFVVESVPNLTTSQTDPTQVFISTLRSVIIVALPIVAVMVVIYYRIWKK
ncbi:MAG: M28 family peptidase [Candidatus Thorarchaeota archaeon]|jgi:hypothetical protein